MAALAGLIIGAVAGAAGKSENKTAAVAGASSNSSSEATTTTSKGTTTTSTSTAPAKVAPTASGLLSGTFTGDLPQGDLGKVAVVATGPPSGSLGSEVPVIVRNNTSKTFGRINLTATARDATGTLIASGSDQGLKPSVVNPGEIAIGYVFFETSVPVGASIDISADGNEPDNFGGAVSVKTTEFNVVTERFGPSLVGSVANDTDKKVSGPVSVLVECFDDAGTLNHTAQGFSEQDSLDVGQTGSFTVQPLKDPCSTFLIGASGYSY